MEKKAIQKQSKQEISMDSIETKEIRGLNLRLIWWIVGSSISLTIVVLSTYSSLVQRLTVNEVRSVESEKYNDLRIRTLDLKVSTLELEVSKLKDEINKSKTP